MVDFRRPSHIYKNPLLQLQTWYRIRLIAIAIYGAGHLWGILIVLYGILVNFVVSNFRGFCWVSCLYRHRSYRHSTGLTQATIFHMPTTFLQSMLGACKVSNNMVCDRLVYYNFPVDPYHELLAWFMTIGLLQALNLV